MFLMSMPGPMFVPMVAAVILGGYFIFKNVIKGFNEAGKKNN